MKSSKEDKNIILKDDRKDNIEDCKIKKEKNYISLKKNCY